MDALLATGEKTTESEVIMAVLNGLPKDYEMVVAILEASDAELALDTILPKLLSVEQRLLRREETDNKAYLARGPSNHRSSSHTNRGVGSNSQPGSSTHHPAQRRTVECWYCGKKGHTKQECRKRLRDEAKASGTSSKHAPIALVAAAAHTGQQQLEHIWAVDSGASCHITPYKHLLSNYQELDRHVCITFGNSGTLHAQGKGTVRLTTEVAGTRKELVLTDVIYVPGANCNLFSVKRADERGATVHFTRGMCTICMGKEVLLEGWNQGDDLYCFAATYKAEDIWGLVTRTSVETAQLWHRRFGHLGYDNLARLQQHGMVNGIHVEAEDFKRAKEQLCDPCARAKQHKEPFQDSYQGATRPLEVLHMDICGPMQEPSLGGNKYVATFLDDYSGLSVVRPIPTKSSVPDIVKSTILLLETQSRHKVQAIRTDNGGEYVNQELTTFLKNRGIVHQTTTPYTPQQNGKA
jgi:hypothetical protein